MYSGGDSYDATINNALKLKDKGIEFSAIETTTRFSLDKYKEIVDTYLSLELKGIFIRPLTRLGKAASSWDKIGYTTDEFIAFYKNILEYMIEKNKEGYFISEGHSCIFLNKILNSNGLNYMELRSPCGAGIGQMAYYYDGKVYTCDEGRMLAEMGSDMFKLGTVDNTYNELINNEVTKTMCVASCLECIPYCKDCVYQPYCGVCPVINYALDGNIFSQMPKEDRCLIYSGMLDTLFELLKDEENEKIFRSWIE